MKATFCTIGKACLRILHGIVDGIWVNKEFRKHVFSTFHSSLHLFPHSLTFHHHVSSSIIEAKQQAFSQYWATTTNPKPLSMEKRVGPLFFLQPCDVHSKPWSLKGGCERHFKLKCRKLCWTYTIMLNHDQLITRIIIEMMGQMDLWICCEIANCLANQCLSSPSKVLLQSY